MPENDALVELAAGLALAHNAYLKAEGIDGSSETSSRAAKILFVVQDGERNAFDQRALEWELLQRCGSFFLNFFPDSLNLPADSHL